MRLKYYLRGLGIGIIVTTIILSISFSLKKDTISDEEIIARAEQLGMIMPETEETNNGNPSEMQENGEENPQDEQNQEGQQPGQDAGENNAEGQQPGQDAEENDAEGQQAEATSYRLIISKGEVCRTICEHLAEGGVIDDAEAFRKYLFELGYASNLSTGVYDIPYGLTMEQVAQILRDGPIEE